MISGVVMFELFDFQTELGVLGLVRESNLKYEKTNRTSQKIFGSKIKLV